jgi:hypothetical protein
MNAPAAPGRAMGRRRGDASGDDRYFKLLLLAFTFFNTLRVVAYLPTMVLIAHTGQSDQHSLFTWVTWLGANATMAAWLYQHNGRRWDRTVLVNVGNASMCAVTVGLISWFRF